jgi:hypothetical protein
MPEELKQVAGLGPPSLLLQWVVLRNFVVGRPAAEIITKPISFRNYVCVCVCLGGKGIVFIVQLPFFLNCDKD